MSEALTVAAIEARVLERISSLTEAKTLLLAVSGGPDSVALVRLLVGSGYRLEVAHFDHALREDSAEDAAFVRDLCEKLEVPFHTERADVRKIVEERGWNLEDAARRLRYTFLTRTAKRIGAGAVVTGHTQGDQAETVLLQLLRGAAFLRGMSPRQGQVIRPLLNTSRRELLDYLEAIGQNFRVDASNTDTTRNRAWLRHEVLPRLEQRYPGVKRTLARLASIQQGQQVHFTDLAEALVRDEGADVGQLRRRGLAVQRQVIALLAERTGVTPDFEQIEVIRNLLFSSKPTRIALPKGRVARVAYGRLEVLTPQPRAKTMPTPASHLPAEVDPDKATAFPNLVIRTRQPGDRIRLAGSGKKLSELLIDRKIPREERDSLCLLASGREVLWVEGVAVDVRVAKSLTADEDVRWMRLALAEAKRAAERGELPVGAVVVQEGEIVGVGANATETESDPTAHAEILALRAAAARLGDWRLAGGTLFVTLEPCPMCFGAMLQAHLPRLVYGAKNHREGALGSVADLREAPWKRELAVRGGVLAQEAERLLSAFFEKRRARKSGLA